MAGGFFVNDRLDLKFTYLTLISKTFDKINIIHKKRRNTPLIKSGDTLVNRKRLFGDLKDAGNTFIMIYVTQGMGMGWLGYRE